MAQLTQIELGTHPVATGLTKMAKGNIRIATMGTVIPVATTSKIGKGLKDRVIGYVISFRPKSYLDLLTICSRKPRRSHASIGRPGNAKKETGARSCMMKFPNNFFEKRSVLDIHQTMV